MHLIDVESGEVVLTRGRRADLTALVAKVMPGANIATLHVSDGRPGLLDGIAGGVRVVEYTPPVWHVPVSDTAPCLLDPCHDTETCGEEPSVAEWT